MASSVTFPGQSHDQSSSQLPPSPSRPPHLPFRRISLPSVPHALENRRSFVSVASFDSTPEEGRPMVPSLMKTMATQQKARAHPHPHGRPPRTSTSKRRETLNASLVEKRRKVVNEILETERAYVDGLDLIYSNFLMPLIASLDTTQPLLGRAELTSIFSNFIDIWNLHRSFFTSLTSLLTDMTDPPPLSPVLMSHFPYLSLYTPFVTSFPTMLGSFSTLMASSPTFSNFIRTQEANPQCGKLGLRDWLLTIVQRCPRYLLLLKDLIGCTDRSDPEYVSLTAVHTLLSKITLSLNTSLHTHSQMLSLLSLQRATPNLPFQLITPGRSLVRRGPLLQGQIEHELPDEREFILFSDCLIWLARADQRPEGNGWGSSEMKLRRPKMRRGRSKSETELPPFNKNGILEPGSDEKWSFKGRAELVDLEVVINPAWRRDGQEDQDERARFDVLSPEVSFSVYAASEDERDEWTETIRDAKSSLLVSLNMMHPNSTLTSSEATTHIRLALQALPHPPDQDGDNPRRGKVDHFVPAIWVPDSKSESCMRCGSRFGWRRRRHHCRLCGRCVCGSCSGKTFFISDASTKSTKPARSCNACYETVFPLLDQSSTSAFSTQHLESNLSQTSTLGTLSQLPSWKSMPSFSDNPSAAGRTNSNSGWSSPSALFNPPPSAFHEPVRSRIRPRPQSQPVMAGPHLNASPTASANASSVNLHAATSTVSLNSEQEGGEEEARPDPKRFSVAALAVHTASVTTRPSVLGEGRSKRFSLVLGKSAVQKQQQQQGQEQRPNRGIAAGKLSEILGRGRRQGDAEGA